MKINKQSNRLESFILKLTKINIKTTLIFLMIIFSFIMSSNLRAATFSVTCDRWESIEFWVYRDYGALNSACKLVTYGGNGEYTDWKCLFSSRCVSWRVTVNAESVFNELSSGTLYNKVIGAILDNKTNFRDHIINMLDTVTLQKIYDPNNVLH